MKRIFVCLLLCAGLGTSAFANVELLLNLGLLPVSAQTFTEKHDGKPFRRVKKRIQFGLDLNILEPEINTFFLSPTSFLDVGINMNVNFIPYLEWGGKAGVTSDGKKYAAIETADAFDSFFGITLGPAVRFNLNERNSFLVSPGLHFDIGFGTQPLFSDGESDAGSSADYSYYDLAFTLDLGYRFWFVSRSDFCFGLALGTDLSFPFWMGSNYTPDDSDNNYSISYSRKGFGLRVYIGVVFNSGERSIDLL